MLIFHTVVNKTVLVLLGGLLFFASTELVAQENSAVIEWQFTVAHPPVNDKDSTKLVFTAKIKKGWQLYSSDFTPADFGPSPTHFEFDSTPTIQLLGPIHAVGSRKKKDKDWGTEIAYFTKQGDFFQWVKIEGKPWEVTGTIHGQVCNEQNGVCEQFSKTFKF